MVKNNLFNPWGLCAALVSVIKVEVYVHIREVFAQWGWAVSYFVLYGAVNQVKWKVTGLNSECFSWLIVDFLIGAGHNNAYFLFWGDNYHP